MDDESVISTYFFLTVRKGRKCEAGSTLCKKDSCEPEEERMRGDLLVEDAIFELFAYAEGPTLLPLLSSLLNGCGSTFRVPFSTPQKYQVQIMIASLDYVPRFDLEVGK